VGLLCSSVLHLGRTQDLDPDMINDIFGTGLDSARYGIERENGNDNDFEEIIIPKLPSKDDCGPMVSPSVEPPMMELHEELRVIQVIKAAQDLKCEHYKDRGYECVPYYQCDDSGEIITDGYGLMDIRSGLSKQEPNFGILDSSDAMCPGSLDICCKDTEFSTTAAPITSTESNNGGGGYNGGSSGKDDYEVNYEEVDYSEEEYDGGNNGGYNGGNSGGNNGGYNGGENGGYNGGENGGYNGGVIPDEGPENSSEEEGDGRGDQQDGNGCVYGKCHELEKQKFKPQCGRRNNFGLGVRIQGFKEGESQFGEWPHICAILMIDEQADGYVTKEVKVFQGGASLIAAGAVLTAAHKVSSFVEIPEKLVVRCGEWDTQTTGEPLKHQDRIVKKVVLHPEFNRKNLANTAAILILEEEFELSQHVDTICMPEIQENFDDATDCHVKGWGKDKWEDGDYQVILKSVQMPVVNSDSCLNQLKTTKLGRRFRLHPSFMCAGGQLGEDACFGDGGGPLVCPLKQDPQRYVQVGIVAWGIGCGQGVPGIYTSLPAIGCWIDYELKCNFGDAYNLRYDSSSCQSWWDRMVQFNQQKCEVEWPARSEYQRQISDKIDDGLKPQTNPVKIEQNNNVGGYGK